MKIKILNAQTQVEIKEINLAEAIAARGECLLGRSPNSGLVLESSDVSRLHGKFSFEDGSYCFYDLGSANGSLVNSKMALANHRYSLKSGDIIRIGEFVLILHEVNAYPEALPATVIGDPNATVIGGLPFDPVHIPNLSPPVEVIEDLPLPVSTSSADAESISAVTAEGSEEAFVEDAIAPELGDEIGGEVSDASPLQLDTVLESSGEPETNETDIPATDTSEEYAADHLLQTAATEEDLVQTAPDGLMPDPQAEAEDIPPSPASTTASNRVLSQENLTSEAEQALPPEFAEITDRQLEPVILADQTVIQSADWDQPLDSVERSDAFSDATVIQTSDWVDEDEDKSETDGTESLINIESTTIQAVEPEPIDSSTESIALLGSTSPSDENPAPTLPSIPISQQTLVQPLDSKQEDFIPESVETDISTDEPKAVSSESKFIPLVDSNFILSPEPDVVDVTPELGILSDSNPLQLIQEIGLTPDHSIAAPPNVEPVSEDLDALAPLDSVSETLITPLEPETPPAFEETDFSESAEPVTELEAPLTVETLEKTSGETLEEASDETSGAIAQVDSAPLPINAPSDQTSLSYDETLERDIWADAEEAIEPQTKQIDESVALSNNPTITPTAPAVIEAINQPIDQDIEQDEVEPEPDAVQPQNPEPVAALPLILREKYIALLAHENHQSDLVQLVTQHQALLSQCLTVATPAVSEMIYQQAGFQVTQQTPTIPPGGYQTVNSLITSGKILAVIFLRDFFTPQATQANDEALSRSCNIYEVLFANNLPTSEAIIHYIQTAIARMS